MHRERFKERSRKMYIEKECAAQGEVGERLFHNIPI